MRKKNITTIGLAYNLRRADAADDSCEEYDEIETIEALEHEIIQCGFSVVRCEQDEHFIDTVRSARVDFVFNIAEGRGHTRGRESQVPCVLESLGIPYSGSDPIALGIALDKRLTRNALAAAGVSVGAMHTVSSLRELRASAGKFSVQKKFIVKPRWEGSSKGVFLHSVCSGYTRIAQCVTHILRAYHQPAVVEEFLPGDEITVGVCGNAAPVILGMMRIVPRRPSTKPFLYSLETKRQWQELVEYQAPDAIPVQLRKLVSVSACNAFSALELRDIARIDFRCNTAGVPCVIDVNPLPGLSPRYSDLPILARLSGVRYADLVKKILFAALTRHGVKGRARHKA